MPGSGTPPPDGEDRFLATLRTTGRASRAVRDRSDDDEHSADDDRDVLDLEGVIDTDTE
jgi:hypothetical protein